MSLCWNGIKYGLMEYCGGYMVSLSVSHGVRWSLQLLVCISLISHGFLWYHREISYTHSFVLIVDNSTYLLFAVVGYLSWLVEVIMMVARCKWSVWVAHMGGMNHNHGWSELVLWEQVCALLFGIMVTNISQHGGCAWHVNESQQCVIGSLCVGERANNTVSAYLGSA